MGETGQKGERGEPDLPGQAGITSLPGPQGPTGQRGGGVVYTRWGRTVCPGELGTQLVYDGYAGGIAYNAAGGGGANFLCMTKQPRYLRYQSGVQGISKLLGTEYDSSAGSPFVCCFPT